MARMDHADHVALLRKGVPQPGGAWADLGAGSGAFTLALAELLGPAATVIAVDRDGRALRRLGQAMATRYPAVTLRCVAGDFTRPLDLPPLDGAVMANALHFVARGEQEGALRRVCGLLRPGGRLIVVEYNTDRGNLWVPHPLTFAAWQRLALRAGFAAATLLATRPSSSLGGFYAGLAVRDEDE
jgi:ubiquinone/menaquinone biosynthesis C-methylase UbiE